MNAQLPINYKNLQDLNKKKFQKTRKDSVTWLLAWCTASHHDEDKAVN